MLAYCVSLTAPRLLRFSARDQRWSASVRLNTAITVTNGFVKGLNRGELVRQKDQHCFEDLIRLAVHTTTLHTHTHILYKSRARERKIKSLGETRRNRKAKPVRNMGVRVVSVLTDPFYLAATNACTLTKKNRGHFWKWTEDWQHLDKAFRRRLTERIRKEGKEKEERAERPLKAKQNSRQLAQERLGRYV